MNLFQETKFWWFSIAVALIFVTTAWFSTGYYHADEHYQLIEFAGFKLGTHHAGELAWEFQVRMRPALQPAIAYVCLGTLQAAGVSDPYMQTFALRLLSALLSFIFLTFFTRRLQYVYGQSNSFPAFQLLQYFTWFVPFLAVRFSSETWSGLFLLGGIGLLFNPEGKSINPIKLGLLLGISFLFRFQMAFAVLGIFAWLTWIKRETFRNLLIMSGSFLAVTGLGFLIDSWFYEQWVFTPWIYLMAVIDSAGTGFGVEPWYFYLWQILFFPGFIIGLTLTGSLIFLLYNDWRNPILWAFIPFLLIHSLIPHKEMRFLFPIAFLVPTLLHQAWILIKSKLKAGWILRTGMAVLLVFVAFNTIALTTMLFKPAGLGRVAVMEHIHRQEGHQPLHLIFCSWGNPYNPWQSIPKKFYLEKEITFTQIRNICQLNDSLLQTEKVNLFVCRQIDLQKKECLSQLEKSGFVLQYKSVSNFAQLLNWNNTWFDSREVLYLFKKLQPNSAD